LLGLISSLAMFGAIRCASSRAKFRRRSPPRLVLEINVSDFWPLVVFDDKASARELLGFRNVIGHRDGKCWLIKSSAG
jgi:hypothetical protein